MESASYKVAKLPENTASGNGPRVKKVYCVKNVYLFHKKTIK